MTAHPAPRFRDVLALRPFRLLFSAHVLSLVGSECTSVGLALLAYDLAGEGAAQVLGLALALRITAFVLVAPFAGSLADRYDRKVLLVGADLVRVGVVASLFFVDAVWQVYLLIFLLNTVTAVFTPTYQAVIPEVTGEQRYLTAVSLSRIAYDLATIGGPLVAAALVAAAGFRLTFWFDAATFMVSALLVLAAGFPGRPVQAKPGSPWSDVATGVRTLFGHPVLRYGLLLNFAGAVTGAAIIVDSIVYAKEYLGLGDAAYGLLMGAAGLGSILGALVARRRQAAGSRLPLMLAGPVLLGAATLPVILQPGIELTAVLWLAVGFAQSLMSVPAGAFLGELVPSELRGRTFAANFAVTHAWWLVTYPLAGYGAAWIGAPATFTAAGAVVLVLAVVSWFAEGRRQLARERSGGGPRSGPPNKTDRCGTSRSRTVPR